MTRTTTQPARRQAPPRQAPPRQAPPRQAPRSHAFPGPDDIDRIVLDNGLRVLVRENHSAPVVVVEGLLPAGAIHDPVDKDGVSSFVASMLTRGSEHYDFDRFNETIESVGAGLSAGSDTHGTNFGATCLSEDFATITAILADVLRRPTFPLPHVQLVRSQKLVRIQERDEDTQEVAHLRFYESIYGNHPYANPTDGYAETVSAVGRDDLLDFYSRRFTPDGAVIVVAGDVDARAAVDLLQQHFADWRGPQADQAVPAIQPLTGARQFTVPLPGKFQSDIVVGCQAVARAHPDFYTVRVANTILGQFGMMGRLGERVREEQGLAYYSYSSLDADAAGGVWLAAAGVSPGNVQQAVDSILAEFQRLADEPVRDAELADSQAYLTGVLPLTLETNDGVAATLLNMEWHGLGLDYLERYQGLIDAITPADVQRVARQYLRQDAYALVVAGP